MDKSCHSSGGGDSSGANSGTTITSGGGGGRGGGSGGGGGGSINSDGYLRELNKMSHKIAKPIRRQSNVIEPQQNQSHANLNQQVQPSQSQPLNQNQQHQHQPPVYNINKSDFRDVVQRLTGSPAHERERFSNPAPPPRPPPMQQPRPPISRLHRIRPPPLAQISNRPPNLLNCAPPPRQPQQFPTNQPIGGSSGGFLVGQRQPLSPLPPFPSVHGAAESPISAYMRFLQNAVSAPDNEAAKSFQPPQFSLLPPRCNTLVPAPLPPPSLQQPNIQHQHQQQNIPPPLPPQYQQQQNVPPPPATYSAPYPQFPSSPLPFGCSSPGLLSPSMLFSPTGQLGFQQVPLSPSMPGPNTNWNDM